MRTVDAASVFATAAAIIASALLPASGPPRAVAGAVADGAAAGDVACAVGGVDAGAVAGADVAVGAVPAPVAPGAGVAEAGPLAARAVTEVTGARAGTAPWLLAPDPHAVRNAAAPQAARAIMARTLAAPAGPRARLTK
jgi:fermentation-respiration switch protein FrsA (DUF1100 family)